ncbi:type II secretion system F family protein [Streptomyces sp. NPDC058195]|uniref:type II secretion system F family protein n=1 Tax=Streptomyces sp. NPDC058195 TaxID=3346375 RepID=UPI0036ECD99B
MNVATSGSVQQLTAMCAVLVTVTMTALALAGLRRQRVVRRRGEALMAVDGRKKPWIRLGHGRTVPGARIGEWTAPPGVVAAGWVLAGGLLGYLTGLAGAYGARRWQRTRRGRASESGRAESSETRRQLPLVADLLAACLSAGAGPREAAEAVGESLGGPVGARLVRAAAEIRLGGDPSEAWGRFGAIPGAGPLARCLDRAGSTGAPAAEPVARLAEAMRAERASAAVARAQRAGVAVTAPVGLCFLPAFLLIGVAPVVIGLATGLLHAG